MRVCLFAMILFGLTRSLGQPNLPDSVSQQLKEIPLLKDRIEYLNGFSKIIMRSNPTLSNDILAYTFQQSAQDELLEARVKINLAIYQMYFGSLDSASVLLKSSKNIIDNSGNDTLLMQIYSELGSVNYYQSNDSATFQYWYRALEIAQTIDDEKSQSMLYNNLALLYSFSKEHSKAIEFLKESIRLKEKLGNIAATGKSYHNIGIEYDMLGEKDSALYFFEKGREIRENNNDLKGLTSSYSSLGKIYFEKNEVDTALMFFEKAINLEKQLGDKRALAYDLQLLGETYRLKGQPGMAIKYTDQSLEIAQEIRVVESAYLTLARSYTSAGNFRKSAEYFDKYTVLHDSLLNESRIRAIEDVEEKYNARQNELEIENLQKENQLITLEAQKVRQQRLLFLLGFLLLIVAVVAILFILKIRNQKNKLLKVANVKLSSLNNTKDRLFSIISHDLKSPLSSFHLITKSITENYDKLDKEQVKEYLITLRDSSANVRDMMDNLLRWALAQTDQLNYSPAEIEAMSTIESVKSQLLPALELKKIKVKVPVESSLEVRADREFLEIIIRNLISNAIKFSRISSEIEVVAKEDEHAKMIAIKDQGVGMPQDQIEKLFKGELMASDIKNSSEKGTGIGLSLSMELMKKMGGTIEVQSEEQKGTTFTLVFPKAA